MKNNSVARCYRQLFPILKTVIRILAVQVVEFRQKNIILCLNSLGDRAHRIGQTRSVTVYRLVVKDSIEEQIPHLHKEKRDLAESLLTGSDKAGKISAEDLLGLLQGNKIENSRQKIGQTG